MCDYSVLDNNEEVSLDSKSCASFLRILCVTTALVESTKTCRSCSSPGKSIAKKLFVSDDEEGSISQSSGGGVGGSRSGCLSSDYCNS